MPSGWWREISCDRYARNAASPASGGTSRRTILFRSTDVTSYARRNGAAISRSCSSHRAHSRWTVPLWSSGRSSFRTTLASTTTPRISRDRALGEATKAPSPDPAEFLHRVGKLESFQGSPDPFCMRERQEALGLARPQDGGFLYAPEVFDANQRRFGPTPRLDQDSLATISDCVDQTRELCLGLPDRYGLGHPVLRFGDHIGLSDLIVPESGIRVKVFGAVSC